MFADRNGKLESVDVPIEPFAYAHEFFPQMNNFLRAILGIEAPSNSSHQAVQLMEMLDAIYESSVTGREVSLVE
jgi:predicted dehydrogenase